MTCTCGTQITCGCQRRTASDGSARCSSCIDKYEASLHAKPHNDTDPIIRSVVYNPPKLN